MTTTQVTVVLVIVLVILAAALVAGTVWRRRRLRSRFGPEYDRVVEDQPNRTSAETELLNREKRHAKLELQPITGVARQRYLQRWRDLQAQFVSDPDAAVIAGDDLVTRLIHDRGYPTRDYDEQLSLLSVEHARTLGAYRVAHEIYLRSQRGAATTEDLRQALVHYREIFADVLEEDPQAIVDNSSNRSKGAA